MRGDAWRCVGLSRGVRGVRGVRGCSEISEVSIEIQQLGLRRVGFCGGDEGGGGRDEPSHTWMSQQKNEVLGIFLTDFYREGPN